MATYLGTEEKQIQNFQDDLVTFIWVLGKFWNYWVDYEYTLPDGKIFKPNSTSYFQLKEDLEGSLTLAKFIAHWDSQNVAFSVGNLRQMIEITIGQIKDGTLLNGNQESINKRKNLFNEDNPDNYKLTCDPVELYISGIGKSIYIATHEMLLAMPLSADELSKGIWNHSSGHIKTTKEKIADHFGYRSFDKNQLPDELFEDKEGRRILGLISDPYFCELTKTVGENIHLSRLYPTKIQDLGKLMSAGGNSGGHTNGKVAHIEQGDYKPQHVSRIATRTLGSFKYFRQMMSSMMGYEGFTVDSQGKLMPDLSNTDKGKFTCPAARRVVREKDLEFISRYGYTSGSSMVHEMAELDSIIIRDLHKLYEVLENVKSNPELLGNHLEFHASVYEEMSGETAQEIKRRFE